MAYQRNYSTNHTTQLSLRGKFKSASKIASAVRHNRRIGREGQGIHIDERRKALNRDLLKGDEPDNIYLSIINRATGGEYTPETVPAFGEGEALHYKDGGKIRQSHNGDRGNNDAVLAFETEMRYPGNMVWSTFDGNGNIVPVPDGEVIDEVAAAPFGKDVMVDDKVIGKGKGYFLYPEDMQEFDAWCEASLEFQKKRFGERNVLSARVHMDEGTPHIHTICSPFVMNKKGFERLSFGRLIGGRSGFYELQDDYAEAVAHLGYKRGEQYSPNLSVISTKEYKAGLNKAINAGYPKDYESAKQEIKDLRAEAYELEVKLKETRGNARTIQRLRISSHERAEEIKKMKEENERLRREAEQQRRVIEVMERKKQIEEKGQEIHPNQEAVGLVLQMREQFMEMGMQYYKDLGYDMDLKYYGDYDHERDDDRGQAVTEPGGGENR